jgi:hypothetical protein
MKFQFIIVFLATIMLSTTAVKAQPDEQFSDYTSSKAHQEQPTLTIRLHGKPFILFKSKYPGLATLFSYHDARSELDRTVKLVRLANWSCSEVVYLFKPINVNYLEAAISSVIVNANCDNAYSNYLHEVDSMVAKQLLRGE